MGDFNKLGLKKNILQVLAMNRFKEPLEIQEKVIPLALRGDNIVFTSPTGSGKTLAYTIPFLSKINTKIGIQMMVIVPTRELANQVLKEIIKLAEPLGINAGALYGGRDINADYKTTKKKIHIMVGTPGRLIDHINEKTIKVGEVQHLIFDESDQMFDNGFVSDCAYLKRRCSTDVQIILSSATLTERVDLFIQQYIEEYHLLKIGAKIPKNIIQENYNCKIKRKDEFIAKYLDDKRKQKIIIFVNKKIRTEEIAEFLQHNHFKAKAISSDLEQVERDNLINLFKSNHFNILVATDVAARGLHIEKVDLVLNYDVPTRPEFYVHRIGRTGRLDSKGHSLTIVCPEDEDRYEEIKEEFNIRSIDISNKYQTYRE